MSQITAAFKILSADAHVKAILVNIFGGIMKCDIIAEGVRMLGGCRRDQVWVDMAHTPAAPVQVVQATKEVGLKIPLIVRLEGTNVEKGKEIINSSGLNIITAKDLDDAAQKACAAL